MAEVKHDPHVGTVDLVGDAQRVLDLFEPIVHMRIEGKPHAVGLGERGDLPHEFNGAGVAAWIGWLSTGDQQSQHGIAPAKQGERRVQPRIVGRFGVRGDVEADVDLVEFETRGIECAQPFRHMIEPEVSGAGVAQVPEHFGLFGERTLAGVMGVHAQREERPCGAVPARRETNQKEKQQQETVAECGLAGGSNNRTSLGKPRLAGRGTLLDTRWTLDVGC